MKILMIVIGAIIFLQIFFSPFFTVTETQQAIILQLGKPVRTIDNAGLHFKLPAPIQNVHFFEKRILEYDSAPTEIITKDKKTMIIDNFARWRIEDPLKFYTTVKNIHGAQARLDDIVYSELRVSLGKHNLDEILSKKRNDIMNEVTINCKKTAEGYGIDILDVRIKRADLPKENEQSVFERMRAERMRKANKYRSEGEEESMKIKAAADKERTIILAEARAKAEQIRGEGDAIATKIFADAFSKNPEFFQLLKTLDAYKATIDSNSVLILPIEKNEFFKYIKKP